MIVDLEDRIREATQEDIVIFDRALVPPVLAHPSALEGVFPFDGVLARVEVKSRLTRGELEKAVRTAKEVHEMKFFGPPEISCTAPISTVFAFESDLIAEPINELARLLSVVDELGLHYGAPCNDIPGPIIGLCVVGRGCWTFGRTKDGVKSGWLQAKMISLYDEILHFVGMLSNCCFSVHHDRESGRLNTSASGVGGGIGNFILDSNTYEFCAIQEPPRNGK